MGELPPRWRGRYRLLAPCRNGHRRGWNAGGRGAPRASPDRRPRDGRHPTRRCRLRPRPRGRPRTRRAHTDADRALTGRMRRAPNEPLPGPPDPWASSEMPAFRGRPPYVMSEMIAAEPALAERLLRRLSTNDAMAKLTSLVRDAVAAGEPIITTGCGTSEHAAMAIAAMLNDALGLTTGRDVRPIQALEALRRPPAAGVVIGVSHEGGTHATNEALRAARDAGATTALITVGDGSPGDRKSVV